MSARVPRGLNITSSSHNSNPTTHRRLSSPSSGSSDTENQLHVNRDRDRNARHSRNTSWSTGYNPSPATIAGDSGDSHNNHHNTSYATTTAAAASTSSSHQGQQPQQFKPRRRRESSLSHTSVLERESGGLLASHEENDHDHDYDHDYDFDYKKKDNSRDTMALRNTSLDWKEYHARSRSQTITAAQDVNPSASASSSPLYLDSSSALPSGSSGPPPPPPVSSSSRPGPVTWMTLPRKKQLAILGLCRVFDFLQIASLQAYMFYQLKSFDQDLSDSDVSTQAGILQGAFTAAQFATAIPWGRVADAEWGGRKFVLLVGLLGTSVSCLGVAFAKSFAQAVFWRSFGGAINGTVGIIRTAIAENVKEKKYHSRAFLILPIGFNIASLFGPGEFYLFFPHVDYWQLLLTGGSHGWYASRSRPDLSYAFRSQLVVRWSEWGSMADDLSLCLAHAGQCFPPGLVRWLCRHEFRRGT